MVKAVSLQRKNLRAGMNVRVYERVCISIHKHTIACSLSVTGCQRGKQTYSTLALWLAAGWGWGGQLGTRHPVGEAGTDGAPDSLSSTRCQLHCSREPLGSVGPLADTSTLCFSQQLV